MTDVFKKVYTTLRPSSSALILEVKTQAEVLLNAMDRLVEGVEKGCGVSPAARELALAKTNLEQAIMWYTKAVVLKDEEVQTILL